MAETRTITLDELKAHTKKDDFYVLLNGKVYNVTKFLDEHPGGDEVIMAEAGKDATEAFEDVGHSDEARAILPEMLVGNFEGAAEKLKAAAYSSSKKGSNAVNNAVESTSNLMYFVPLSLLGAYFAWRFYSGSA